MCNPIAYSFSQRHLQSGIPNLFFQLLITSHLQVLSHRGTGNWKEDKNSYWYGMHCNHSFDLIVLSNTCDAAVH